MTLPSNPQTGEKMSETLVRFIVEHVLGVRVCCYDDRRGISRPDAIIHRNGGVPLEIVSDPLVSDLQLTNALRRIDRRATFAGLQHGYLVCLTNAARVKDLSWLERTLHLLENPAEQHSVARRTKEYMFIKPVESFSAGEVRFTTGQGGGRPIPHAHDLVSEATSILARPQYADVARKLGNHGGAERHAVLVVDEDKTSTFSWLREAESDDVAQLPAPELPEGITHLWITPRYGPGLTALWSPPTGWQGEAWRWGHPTDALEAWEDPLCLENHAAEPQPGTA